MFTMFSERNCFEQLQYLYDRVRTVEFPTPPSVACIAGILERLNHWDPQDDGQGQSDLATKWVSWLDRTLPIVDRGKPLYRSILQALSNLCDKVGCVPASVTTSTPVHGEDLLVKTPTAWIRTCTYNGRPAVIKITRHWSIDYQRMEGSEIQGVRDRNNKLALKEGLLTRLFDFPHVIKALAVIVGDDLISDSNGLITAAHAIVMPRMAHGSLYAYVKAGAPGSLRLQLLGQALAGLLYLHSMGFVHQDVKSENILVDEDMRAYLSDLAMARPNGGPYGAIMGTPGFIPPEVLIGGEDTMPSYAGDVYRTACTIWQALSGKLPHWDEDRCEGPASIRVQIDIVEKHARPPRADIGTPVSDELWSTVDRAWSHDVVDRPTLHQLLDAVARECRAVTE